ncbi:MAG: LacI family DNA-binding transcriptional regulator [Anaerolineae bacterium]|jgi:LacI family transcriptional regulator|nr:LacI family DNA-binding transcriptional regulator [Anaerolineae bacterium]
MQDKRVTIDDVAAAVGVSRQTVSRAINNLAGISSSTREKVLSAARQLGYRPSNIARGLANASQQTRTLGIVLPSVDNEFYAAVLHGIESQTSKLGYQLFLCSSEEDPDLEFQKTQSLFSLWIDGLILCSSRMSDDQLQQICDQVKPVVLINRAYDHPHAGNVLIDDFKGTYQAVHHLLQKGHRKIGFILGLPFSRSGQLRRQGYLAAMQEAGAPVIQTWSIHSTAAIDSGYHTAKTLLKQHPELTALVVYNDVRTAGVLRACKEMNYNVPDQIAIISHDNIALSSLLIPSLSTVNIPKEELGQQAIKLMMSMLEEPEHPPTPIQLTPQLILRESCPE